MTTDGARPLVSVVIPAYNDEGFLAATIESVLAQTYRPLEVVVVDDGSSDGTVALARSFGDPVRVVEQENKGPAGARNTGFAAARGSIIALLDADDLWMPKRLEACVDLLQSDPTLGFVTTDAYIIDEDTPTEQRYYGAYQRYPFPPRGGQLDEIAKRNFVFVSAVIVLAAPSSAIVVPLTFDPGLSDANESRTKGVQVYAARMLICEPTLYGTNVRIGEFVS